MMVLGTKVQVRLDAGETTTSRLIVPVNPLTGEMTMVVMPTSPALKSSVVELVVMV